MVELIKYLPHIKVELENGVYVFDGDSSTGKTYLCNLLKEKCCYGEPVTGYSYDDYLLNVDIGTRLIPNKYKVIMLDRYDMFHGVGEDLIKACAKNAVVLIDSKTPLNFKVDYDSCGIELTKDLIRVVE